METWRLYRAHLGPYKPSFGPFLGSWLFLIVAVIHVVVIMMEKRENRGKTWVDVLRWWTWFWRVFVVVNSLNVSV